MTLAGLMAVSVPVSFVNRCLPSLDAVCCVILFVAAFLHWHRTRHWSLLVLATGSLVTALSAICSLVIFSTWLLTALSAPPAFIRILLAMLPWFLVFGLVVAAIGGIGAIHWAISLREPHTSAAANTGQPQSPPTADQPAADG